MTEHDSYPVPRWSPQSNPDEALTVREFERWNKFWTEQRDKVISAQFDAMNVTITTGFEAQNKLHEATQDLQKRTNGRLTDAEKALLKLHAEGCGQLNAHKTILKAIHDEELLEEHDVTAKEADEHITLTKKNAVTYVAVAAVAGATVIKVAPQVLQAVEWLLKHM